MAGAEHIHAVPLREHVYGRLQELLIARTLAPGDHLVEERLAAELGVSRGPVREALQRLHRDGWITLRPRHGAFVNQPTRQQVEEFFEARELVERSAAELAAQRCTPEDAAALLAICDEADADWARGVPTQQMAGHTARFHRRVLLCARNHLLLEFGEQLSQRSRWFFAPLVGTIAPRAWAEHREVAELIAAGRAGEAAASMRVHVEESRDSYLETQLVADTPSEPVAFRRTRAPSGSRAGAVPRTPAPGPTHPLPRSPSIGDPVSAGRVVLVTGASSGIGRACVEAFLGEGARVVAAARRTERLEDLRAQHGDAVLPLTMDVRDRAQVSAALGSLPAEWTPIDVLVNNAGLAAGRGPIHTDDPENWDRMLDTNVRGLLNVSACVLPGMVERGAGHVVNVGSNAGREVYPGGAVYCATKAAVERITRGMRMDVLGSGVRISQVDPGMVETEFSLVRFDGDEAPAKAVYEGLTPLSAADVAEVVTWIASRPPHVVVADVLVYPVDQAGSGRVARRGS